MTRACWLGLLQLKDSVSLSRLFIQTLCVTVRACLHTRAFVCVNPAIVDVWELLVTILGHLEDSYYSECLALRWRQWECMNLFYMNSKEPDPSFWWLGSDVDPGHINNRAKFPTFRRNPEIHCVPIVILELFVKFARKFTLLKYIPTYDSADITANTLRLKSSSNTSLALDYMTDLTQE